MNNGVQKYVFGNSIQKLERVQSIATGAEAIRLRASAALATDHLQAGRVDIQDPQHIDTCLPQASHHCTRSALVYGFTAVCALTNFSRRAFCYCTAPIAWNSLPHPVITATHCQLLSLGSTLTCLVRLSVLHVRSCSAVPVLSTTPRL